MRGLTQEEAYAFSMKSIPGGLLYDDITKTPAITSIAGIRYGLINGATTAIPANQPSIEDTGLRGCPAFTQYFLNNSAPVTQSITLVAGSYCLWIEGTGSATFNGLTITAVAPQVFTLASGFTGNCVISGSPTKVMLNSGLFPAPFTPTTGSTVSVVSETSTATTGTSFDLDNTKLSKFTDIIRGKPFGPEKADPLTVTTQTIDANTYSAVAGSIFIIYTNNNSYVKIEWTTALVVGKTYEIIAIADGTPVGSVKNDVSGVILPLNGTPVYYTATNTSLRIARNSVGVIDCSFTLSVKEVQAEGHVEFLFKSNIDSSTIPTTAITENSLISANNSQFNFINNRKQTNGDFQFNLIDNAFSGSTVVLQITPNKTVKISADFGILNGMLKQRITINGVKGPISTFSGSFGIQDLRFFYGNTIHSGWIVKDSLKMSDKPQW